MDPCVNDIIIIQGVDQSIPIKHENGIYTSNILMPRLLMYGLIYVIDPPVATL